MTLNADFATIVVIIVLNQSVSVWEEIVCLIKLIIIATTKMTVDYIGRLWWWVVVRMEVHEEGSMEPHLRNQTQSPRVEG